MEEACVVLIPTCFLLQELLQTLEDAPGRLQAAFVGRAAAHPESPTFALQPRHSLLLLRDLPAVLAEAMPEWTPNVVAYAAAQLTWHVNVVSYTSESPVIGGQGGTTRPSNMMYAEMAASIIAAAETESAARDSRLLPGAQDFVSALVDTLAQAAESGKLEAMWKSIAQGDR